MERTLLTHTKMAAFKNCRCGFQKRFEECVAPRIQTRARSVGSAVHKFLETGDLDLALRPFAEVFPNSQDEQDKLDLDVATVRAICEGYKAYFLPIAGLIPEQKFQLPILNPATGKPSKSFVLAGKIDGNAPAEDGAGLWLVEYKTAGQIDKNYVDKLALDSQVTTYSYALERLTGLPVVGTIYRVMRKPSIRQTKKETPSQFQDRLVKDYLERPDFYFMEQVLYRDRRDLDLYAHELWQITQDVLACRKSGHWYRNTSRCTDWGSCDYMPLCLGQAGAEDLYSYRDPDIELKEEAANAD